MTIELYSFLDEHFIINIGKKQLCEVIVDTPVELISLLKHHDFYISLITWWDWVPIATGSSIGYGGPRDPRDPNNYFFAETDISKEFGVETPPDQYIEYLKKVQKEYSGHDLYPAFEIVLIQNEM